MAAFFGHDHPVHGRRRELSSVVRGLLVTSFPPAGPTPPRRTIRCRLSALIDAITEPVWIADAKGSIVHLNLACCSLGVTPAGSAGEGWGGAVHADDATAARTLWDQALRAGLPFQCSRRVRWQGAGYRQSTTNAVPLRDQSGKIVLWCGVERPTDGRASAGTAARADGETPSMPDLEVDIVLDAGIGALVNSFAYVHDMTADVSALYSQSISLALLARLGHGTVVERQVSLRRLSAPLPKWRLTRVLDYVARNVGEPISLADMAKVAGLTRMYFAAQFRAAMGVCPHDYVLSSRVRHAQRRLLEPGATIVDVALDAGFQTQSHFTTVFKRHVGDTPHRWRLQQLTALDGPAAQRGVAPPARRA